MNILELHNRFRRYCLVEEGLADTTIRDLKSTIRTFLKRTGAKNISDLNLALVKEFFYEGKELYSWSYYRFIN